MKDLKEKKKRVGERQSDLCFQKVTVADDYGMGGGEGSLGRGQIALGPAGDAGD